MTTKLTFEVEYRLKPNQPQVHQIDFEELDWLLHTTIEAYLEELSDSLESDDEDGEDDETDDDSEGDAE